MQKERKKEKRKEEKKITPWSHFTQAE